MTLGDIISEYRVAHSLSMAQFAERAGISKAYVSMLERNRTQRGDTPSPSIEVYRSVAHAIGVDVDELIRRVDGNISLSPESDRILNDEELKVAYFRGADPTLTDEDMDAMWQDAKDFRDFIIQKRNREKYGK